MKIRILFLALLSVLLVTSCAKRKEKKQAEEDDKLIQEYIAEHNLTAIKSESGLYYVIDVPGTGPSCDANSDVRVSYTGYFLNDDVFEQSSAQGISFNLKNVIKGWTEGIPYFKEGGSGTLLIPSALAYGTTGSGSIPKNTVVLFDVSLLEVL